MKYLVRRLDQALRLWEDTCYMTNRLGTLERYLVAMGQKLDGELESLDGAITSWNDFRGDLLRGIDLTEAHNKYCSGPLVSPLHSFPVSLNEWSRNSRRVFHLTEELLTLLSLTSLDGVRWSEVHWPFESFLVTLDQPLVDENGTSFDAILLYRIHTLEQVSIILSHLNVVRDAGVGVLIVTHLINFAEQASDQIIFLDNGEILETGKEVIKNPTHPRVKKFLSMIKAVS
jgi:hypothetical protein